MYVDQLEVIMQKIIKQKKNLKFDFTVLAIYCVFMVMF